ncbi:MULTISPECIES: response regulator transcription factor [unclassified Inquilinus]|uniref:response regulator transcription factor n=1 Tax=unclassified Inquilinus TaxID=2645927 RepID=UPI003F8DEEBD
MPAPLQTPAPHPPRILIIDDEPQIRRFIKISLAADGYAPIEAASGAEGLERVIQDRPDLVILDLGLPDMDGQQVLSRIRELSAVPVIVLSVRAGEAEKVEALDRGANDYVTKPFGIAELTARLRATLRRGGQEEGAVQAVIEAGPLAVDVPHRRVRLDGREIKLSKKEFEILRLLAAHQGRVVTHQKILREVWGPAHIDAMQYLRVYVGQLRQKLGDDPARPHLIATEAGVGYRLVVEG